MAAASSGSGGGPAAGGERQRSWKEVHAKVHAAAREQQVLDLGIRLGTPDGRVELDEHELRDGKPEGAAQFARDDLGDERLRSLSSAAELQHVEAVVVGLDEGRQRPAFAKRRHVAGRGDSAHERQRNPLGH